jgi:hypothetical protein
LAAARALQPDWTMAHDPEHDYDELVVSGRVRFARGTDRQEQPAISGEIVVPEVTLANDSDGVPLDVSDGIPVELDEDHWMACLEL